jgi:hypothetical protein
MSHQQSRCFELAFSAIRNPHHESDVLVHGTIITPRKVGRGVIERQRIAHAWIIVHGDAVYDPMLDRRFKRDHFYKAFAAIEVRRYSVIEAIGARSVSGNNGPWHDDSRELPRAS